MPARTRRGRAAAKVETVVEPEEEEEEEEQQEQEEPDSGIEDANGSLKRLQFDATLSWRAGKPIPVAVLLQRLEELASELRTLDQEETERESLTKVSQELASGHLLGHKDKGVRAWTACCVVDILRLCAPDAPFTVNQLQDIFTLIIRSIIPTLADPSNAYNDQHIYVLSSLADVKSIVLLTDVHAPDTLILPLFSSCFDIVSGSSKASTGEHLAKNVEYDMTRLLVPIIDEAPNLAAEVIDVIVAQFLRVDPWALSSSLPIGSGKSKKGATNVDSKQTTLLLKDYPPAYNMAKAICNACPEKLTSYLSQYFNNVILDASGSAGMNGQSKQGRNQLDDSDDEGENVKDLNKAHRLLRELWRACPDVLQNVIPQLEAELSADSTSLRLLATQTIGDIAAGIGVAGPPPDPTMDPIAYPPPSLNEGSQASTTTNPLLKPLSPKPFPQAHTSAYESFLGRRQDKSAPIRAAWATAIGRILLTSAGGCGLSSSDEKELIKNLARMLGDADDKVRLAAVKIIGKFDLSDIIKKLGVDGGLSEPGSLLSVLAARVKDRKHAVRQEAMTILAKMWAAASGEIEQNNPLVLPIVGHAPSRIFDAFYTNDLDINVLLDLVFFEILLPLPFPPFKSKAGRGESSQSRKSKSSKAVQGSELDPDAIRVRRILTLVKGLDERSKRVFFCLQGRQLKMREYMTYYLTACEDYNGGVMEENEESIKSTLTKIIDALSKLLPDSSRVSADLWKFATMHDRRSYQLIRFAMAAISDYRTVVRAVRELSNRISSSTSSTTTMLDTFTPLLYRSSSLIFNRSHVPTIMTLSRTDEYGLGNTAHEMLREASSLNPEVLEAHIQDICKDLESQAPSAKQADDPSVEEILKACGGFAKKLPAKLPTHRQFHIALTNYALYSSSPIAAKNAVSILIATADRKEMYARDLIKRSVDNFRYGSPHFLTNLATVAQLNLLCAPETDEFCTQTIEIATQQILFRNRNPAPNSGYSWSEEVEEETMAKEWALKILVNRIRSTEFSNDNEESKEYTETVFGILNTLIKQQGQLEGKDNTPPGQRSRLRLLAAKLVVKLCTSKATCERMFTPGDFNAIALVAQDPLLEVRSAFIAHLKKRIVQSSDLNPRWYIIMFLLAFEPNGNLYDSTLAWLRSRSAFFSRRSGNIKGSEQQQHQTTMEALLARLLSLLAHHPDYPPENTDGATTADDLLDFSRYIIFYLTAIANETNLSLIFHIAQRVKQTRDAVSVPSSTSTMSSRLHTLSDLSQATIRRFAEIYSQQHKIGGSGGSGVANILQTYPGKWRLPSSLFSNMSTHEQAQTIAEKNFLPEEVEDKLERLVKSYMKPRTHSATVAGRKRKKVSKSKQKSGGDDVEDGSDGEYHGNGGMAKKPRKEKQQSSRTIPTQRTRKKKGDEDDWGSDDGGSAAKRSRDTSSKTAKRRSGRGATRRSGVSYVEANSDEDDQEMEAWEAQPEEQEVEAEKSASDADSEAPQSDHDDKVTSDNESEAEPKPQMAKSKATPKQKQKAQSRRQNDSDDEDLEMSDVPSDLSSLSSPSPTKQGSPRRQGRGTSAKSKSKSKEPQRAVPLRMTRRRVP
ncbi:hypothetical protein FQN57_003733 [Myotisia sp. PD_48]|nr:hypothetical protein FQN57_003733 [Myotisia sp. PD_48]